MPLQKLLLFICFYTSVWLARSAAVSLFISLSLRVYVYVLVSGGIVKILVEFITMY